MTSYKLTITFELEIPLTGIEKQCLESLLEDELTGTYMVENLKIKIEN